MVELFLDVTLLFSVVQNKNDSASQLNNDLDKVSDWAYSWKMSFNPDPSKQAQEVIFSRKCTKKDHPVLYFNNIHSLRLMFKNILGCILMKNSNYYTHIKEKLSKFYRGTELVRNLSKKLPRQALFQYIRCLWGHSLTMVICKVRLIFLKCFCENLSFCNLMLGEKKKWKYVAQQIPPTHRTINFFQLLKRNLLSESFSISTDIYLIGFNNNNNNKLQNMFKINNRTTRRCSVVIVVNFEYIWHGVLVFFCWL